MLVSTLAGARDIHILVLGDRTAANCHAHIHGRSAGVFVLDPDGQERPALDPLPWSDCSAGSVWMPLAERLSKEPGVEKVVLLPIAISGARINAWLDGIAAKRMDAALAVADVKKLRMDYVLWQQGIADENMSTIEYFNKINAIARAIRRRIPVAKWLIGTTQACPRSGMQAIRVAQARFGNNAILNRFPGASDAGLSRQDQFEDCTLTASGQEKMAQRWLDAIRRADRRSLIYEKESLLYFFK